MVYWVALEGHPDTSSELVLRRGPLNRLNSFMRGFGVQRRCTTAGAKCLVFHMPTFAFLGAKVVLAFEITRFSGDS